MNERIAKLKKQSVETRPYISTERAELVTDFYQSDIPHRESVAVCRALSFKHLLENKTICINDGELIKPRRLIPSYAAILWKTCAYSTAGKELPL